MKKPILVLVLALMAIPFIALQQENPIEVNKDSIEIVDKEPVPDFFVLSVEDKYPSVDYTEDYLDGWENGHCEGWRDVKGMYAICPVAPIAPLPLPGRDDWIDGYNRGFKQGYIDAREDEGQR